MIALAMTVSIPMLDGMQIATSFSVFDNGMNYDERTPQMTRKEIGLYDVIGDDVLLILERTWTKTPAGIELKYHGEYKQYLIEIILHGPNNDMGLLNVSYDQTSHKTFSFQKLNLKDQYAQIPSELQSFCNKHVTLAPNQRLSVVLADVI